MDIEDMDEKQVLAHCRKIKQQAAKRWLSMTAEEEQKYMDAMMKRVEAEYGIKFTYAQAPAPQ
ncbi:MAG: hypothetical protein LBR23_03165 [Spirochaetaceae bacterium]|jgi:biotin synthase-like enzyme|nr:hypothetical protein [Spirochaetaceae bacterium]